MEIILIACLALMASGLTLFSGFGLGTILLPAFALIMPVDTAVAATAIVHLANNLFKVGLVGRMADRAVLLRFAVPATLAALAGAWLLVQLAGLPVIARYSAFGATHEVGALRLAIGVLIVAFAVLELIPAFARLSFPPRFLVLGGLLSGFFGGLSGNQGALRSAFLIKAGLSKEAFIATGVVAAVIVDVARLTVYGVSHVTRDFAALTDEAWLLVGAATLAAFLGAFIGTRLMYKVTLRMVRLVVALAMIVLGAGLAAGLL